MKTGKDYTTSLPNNTVATCFLRDYFDLLLDLISRRLYNGQLKQISISTVLPALSITGGGMITICCLANHENGDLVSKFPVDCLILSFYDRCL